MKNIQSDKFFTVMNLDSHMSECPASWRKFIDDMEESWNVRNGFSTAEINGMLEPYEAQYFDVTDNTYDNGISIVVFTAKGYTRFVLEYGVEE